MIKKSVRQPLFSLKSATDLTERVHAYGSKIFFQLGAGFGRVGMPHIETADRNSQLFTNIRNDNIIISFFRHHLNTFVIYDISSLERLFFRFVIFS